MPITPWKPGESGNPTGRKKGIPNRKTILNDLLFERNINDIDLLKQKPGWFDKVKPNTLYEIMVIAMSIKAMDGDVQAFTAINRALGEFHVIEEVVDVTHIFKPAKIESIEDINRLGQELRDKAFNATEAEVIDAMDSPTGTADVRITTT